MAGWETVADALALGAEPIPASLEKRPRLMPSTIQEPVKPPKIDLKLNASCMTIARTPGIFVILVMITKIPTAM